MIAAEHRHTATSRKTHGDSEPHPAGHGDHRLRGSLASSSERRQRRPRRSELLSLNATSAKLHSSRRKKKGEERARGAQFLEAIFFFFFQNASVRWRSGTGEERGGVGCSSNIASRLADAPPSPGRDAGTSLLGSSLVIYWEEGG